MNMQKNGIYHIHNKGINNGNIFFEEQNCSYFLCKYKKYLSEYIDTFAYCLLPCRFDLLIRVNNVESKQNRSTAVKGKSTLTGLQKAFRDFFISYSKSVNKRYGRTGALLQYKFKRVPLLDEQHLMEEMVRLHMQPVAMGLSSTPGKWKYSSYIQFLESNRTLVQVDEVLALFGGVECFRRRHNDLPQSCPASELPVSDTGQRLL